jgi:AcrR family transcriptional regulator
MTLPDKQAQILEAALRLFVAQGFHGTPTSQIAKEAGVSNGTLFHYYATKEELVVALYNHVKDQLQAYLSDHLRQVPTLQDRLKLSIIRSVQWGLENPQQFYYIQQFHFSPHLAKVPAEVIQRQSQLHLDLLREAIDNQLVRPLPPDFLFALISSQVFGLYQYLAGARLSAAVRTTRLEEGYALLWQMIKA